MKTEEFSKLIDYVADLRSKLQHARTRAIEMGRGLILLRASDAPMVEVTLWREAIQDHATFMETLETQLREYETLVGWR